MNYFFIENGLEKAFGVTKIDIINALFIFRAKRDGTGAIHVCYQRIGDHIVTYLPFSFSPGHNMENAIKHGKDILFKDLVKQGKIYKRLKK